MSSPASDPSAQRSTLPYPPQRTAEPSKPVPNRWASFLILLVALFGVGYFGSARSHQPKAVVIESGETAAPKPPNSADMPTLLPPRGKAASQPTEVVVHVAGAVARPGVYSLRSDGRVIDALEAAGGALEGADGSRLNLASKLTDGQRIVVPFLGEPAPRASAEGDGARPRSGEQAPPEPYSISLNLATQADLERIPGVGPSSAEAIIRFREANGGIASLEELTAIPGFGQKRIDALRPYVTQ